MDLLSRFLSSGIRAAVFKELFLGSPKSLYLRELERLTGFAIGTLQQEMRSLLELEIVGQRRDGNRLYYSANTAHPLFREIQSLVEKTCGHEAQLARAFAYLPIRVAFIYGSFARGKQKANSDFDLLIIGDVSLRQIVAALSDAATVSGRELNPHVVSEKNWKTKLVARDHFALSLLKSEKRFLIGDADVLKGLGK